MAQHTRLVSLPVRTCFARNTHGPICRKVFSEIRLAAARLNYIRLKPCFVIRREKCYAGCIQLFQGLHSDQIAAIRGLNAIRAHNVVDL